VPVAKTSENGLIIIISADYAFWERDLAEVITLMAGKFADQEAATRELWLRGKASPRFVAETGQLGWTVREMIDLTLPRR